MTVLEGVRDFLRENAALSALEIDELGEAPGAACLRPVSDEMESRICLDGTAFRQLRFELLLRRDWSGTRNEDLSALLDLAGWLRRREWEHQRPDLGEGRRARSLTAETAPETFLVQENGLLVDRMTLMLRYFEREGGGITCF